ncbi:MAG: DUF2069 domain-containing protein [Lysobacteraceae bacterium]
MNARRLTAIALLALALLAPLWQFALAPPQRLPAWLATAVQLVPLVPGLVLFALHRRTAPFWAGLGALFAFCHGVMEAFGAPAARVPALIETALAVLVVFASSWNGLRNRFARSTDSRSR